MENILIIIIGICILIALVLILKNNKIDKNKVDFLELENKRLNQEKQSGLAFKELYKRKFYWSF